MKKFILLLIACIATIGLSAQVTSPIVITLDNLTNQTCDVPFNDPSGTPLMFTSTISEDACPGNCFFDTYPSGVWLWPSRLMVDLTTIPTGTYVSSVQVDITDYTGVGAFNAFLEDAAGANIASASNTISYQTETLTITNPTASAVNSLALSTCEGQVTEVRVFFENLVTCNFSVTATISDVSCPGLSNGSISTVVSGAGYPFTYLWSNGATTPDILNLPIGNYTLTVTDLTGCTNVSSHTVSLTPPMVVSGTVTNATTSTANDGSIIVSVTGGTSPYSYIWNSGVANANLTNIPAGSYSLTVYDANQCVAESFFDVFVETGTMTGGFSITINESGLPISGGGTGAFNDPLYPNNYNGWYNYTVTDWWNIWFYNGFDANKYKMITIEFDLTVYNNQMPSYLDFAVNWSTDLWTYQGTSGVPPLPSLVGTSEADFIMRPTLQLWDQGVSAGHYQYCYIIPDYCPEYVSIDVQGYNFEITNGVISHECIAGNPPPTGRCCYTDFNGNTACADNYECECDLLNGDWDSTKDCANDPCLPTGVGEFWIAMTGNQYADPTQTGGNGNFPGGTNGWYDYPSGWWNIWFNNLPFQTNAYKEITVTFDIDVLSPTQGFYVDFAINWSTPVWGSGTQLEPPVPGNMGNYSETDVIIRETVLATSDISQLGQISYCLVIPNYCPGWVSIDVQGYNFIVTNGVIDHQCYQGTPETGRCCYTDVTGATACADNFQCDCDQLGGTWDPNKNCTNDPCLVPVLGACCLPDTCVELTETACQSLNGQFMGPGTSCSTNPCQVENYWQIKVFPNGMPSTNPNETGGTDYYPGGINGWYDYPSGWWNIWFYDHPFDTTRYKEVHLSFFVMPTDPGLPTNLDLAVNWSTDEWSLSTFAANGPPVPQTMPTGASEDLYIERPIIFEVDNTILTPQLVDLCLFVTDYNPEWVSIDVMGDNFTIVNGYIWHACLPGPPPYKVDAGSEIEICQGDCATLSATGGANYQWSNGATGATTSVCPTSTTEYTVTATDPYGCFLFDKVKVIVNPNPSVNLNCTNITCPGDNDGSILPYAFGGTPGYSYAWSDGSSAPMLSGLAAGTYSVTVTDSKGCTATSYCSITEPPELIIYAMTIVAINCHGDTNGAMYPSVSGGTPPYSYQWSNGQTTHTATGLGAGTYTVTVTDANGCTVSDSGTIQDPPAIDVYYVSVVSLACHGDQNGAISLGATGGTPPYSYSWSNGQSTSTITGLGGGTYHYTLTDSNGCTATGSATVIEPPALSMSMNCVDITCFGDHDGHITVSASGGTPGYSYSWSPNISTASTASNLGDGTYSVSVSDSHGCTVSASCEINEPTELEIYAMTVVAINCHGDTNGAMYPSATGGTAPYSYQWSNGQTTHTATGLGAGTYTVTVTDSKGCTATASGTIINPPVITISISKVNVSCFGGSDGSATATASGGVGSKSFAWSNGSNNATISGLSAGNYTLTATDANGCTATASVSISEPPALTLTLNCINITCFGFNNGSITAVAGGGTPGYTYNWNPNVSNNTIANGLAPGLYSVTVIDSKGCTATASCNITQPPLLTVATAKTNVTCNGFADGTASATPAGGTAPYTYFWNNGSITPNIANLAPGIYNVVVTDSKGCTANGTVTITEPPVLGGTVNVTNITCPGGNSGSATAAIGGGTPPYVYNWGGAIGVGPATINGLSAGNYILNVSDANGCLLAIPFVVSAPPPITIISNITNVDCFGNSTGSATVGAGGGTPPYIFNWPGIGPGGTISNMPAGTYTVVVIDANNCTANFPITITEPPALVLSETHVDPSAYGATNGSINLNIAGGTPPYTYLWTNGAITQDINNLLAGTYCVTVTDANNCLDSLCVTLVDPVCPSTNQFWFARNANSMVIPSLTGGTDYYPGGVNGWFDYPSEWWNIWFCNLPFDTTKHKIIHVEFNVSQYEPGASFFLKFAVNYTKPAWDLNNLSMPPLPSNSAVAANENMYIYREILVNSSNASTLGFHSYDFVIPDYCPGWVSIDVQGYNFKIENGVINHECMEEQLGQCCYIENCVALCDDLSEAECQALYGQWNPQLTCADSCALEVLALDLTAINPTCQGACDGQIVSTLTGGVSPYSLSWPGAAINISGTPSTHTINNLCAGSYTVTATDGSGCSVTQTVSLVDPASTMTLYMSVFNPNCNGGSSGKIISTVFGGNPPYTYAWSNGATSALLLNIPSGVYSLTVTNANGCTVTGSATLVDPPLLVATATGTNPTIVSGTDGSIDLSVSGGTPGYTYLWSNGATTEDLSALSAGTYCVTVSDSKGCIESLCITLVDPVCPSTNMFWIGMNANSYPDPMLTGGTDYYPGGINGWFEYPLNDWWNIWFCNLPFDSTKYKEIHVEFNVEVLDPTLPFYFKFAVNYTTPLWDISNLQNPPLPSIPMVQANETLYLTRDVLVNSNMPSVVGFHSYNLVIPDYCPGWVSIDVQGNNFKITNGVINHDCLEEQLGQCCFYDSCNVTCADLSENACNALGGLWNANLTCADACNLVPMSISNSILDVDCYGNNTGYATTTATGGLPPYTYLWSTGSTSPSAGSLFAGSYTVSVTDAAGCLKTAMLTISEPPAIIISMTTTDISCYGNADGTATASVSGGTPSYIYEWDGVVGGTSKTGLAAGSHIFKVFDSNGCVEIFTFTVADPPQLVLSLTGNNPTISGGSNGSVNLMVSGGTYPYTFLWTNGATTMDITGVPAGNYCVTVTDANGCIETACATLVDPLCPSLNQFWIGMTGNSYADPLLSGGTDYYPGGTNGWYEYTSEWWNIWFCNLPYDTSAYKEIHVEFELSVLNPGQPFSIMFAVNYSTPAWDVINTTMPPLPSFTPTIAEENMYIYREILVNSTDLSSTGLHSYDFIIPTHCPGWVSIDVIGFNFKIVNGLLQHDCLQNQLGQCCYIDQGQVMCSYITETECDLLNGEWDAALSCNDPCMFDPPWADPILTGDNHTILISDTTPITIQGTAIEIGDEIAVFYNDSGTLVCGGTQTWTGNATIVVAWGEDLQSSAKDGFSAGEVFKWKIWDASEAKVYDAQASYDTSYPNTDLYASNGISSLASLETLSCQTLILDAGWDIISTHILPSNPNVDVIMTEVKNNISLMKNKVGLVYWPSIPLNMIGDWVTAEGYQIKMTTADTLEICGDLLDPATTPVVLSSGWSLFAYLCQTEQDVAAMLTSVVNNVSLVKSADGSVYWPVFGVNSIGNFVPGKGYQAKMLAQDTLYYPCGIGIGLTKSMSQMPSIKHFDTPANTGNNMILGIPNSAWDQTPLIGDEVAVFTPRGEIVGSSAYTGEHLAIAVWGDDKYTTQLEALAQGEKFMIRLWHHNSGKEEVVEITSWLEGDNSFSENGISIAQKAKVTGLDGSSYVLYQNIPNPFKETTEIRFYLPKTSKVELDVYTILGEKVEEICHGKYAEGEHTVIFNSAMLKPGTYFYKLRTPDFSGTHAMSIIR